MTEVCPVCGGRGTVAQGFYEGINDVETTNTGRVTCRACGGTGIINDA